MRYLLNRRNTFQFVVCLLLSGSLILAGCNGAVPDSTTTETTESDVTGTPAAFTVSTLKIKPLEVKIRENVDISVVVTNIGEETGSYEVELRIDGVLAD